MIILNKANNIPQTYQESFSITPLDPSQDGINIYGSIEEREPKFMQDLEFKSSQ